MNTDKNAQKATSRSRKKSDPTIAISLIDKGASVLTALIKAGMWVGIAYFAVQAIEHLAGKNTSAQFLLSYLTGESESHSPVIWMVLTGVFAVWASAERWVRLRKVSSMSSRIESLERRLDPSRSSSGLTKSGETPINERNS